MSPTNRRLDDAELQAAMKLLEGWTLDEQQHLTRTFHFGSFAGAMGFMAAAAIEADKLDHHPNWSNVYDRVEVTIWSHDLGGVSALCVALARKMNELAP